MNCKPIVNRELMQYNQIINTITIYQQQSFFKLSCSKPIDMFYIGNKQIIFSMVMANWNDKC